ncbi:plasma membrane repair [Desmophyllum pertusum]|uniref:Plasma membrane repair n=1 Tax=Desmophyllum pertusum TaxID=174260 RepID=A0A9X0D5A8_9CNID|nr:plasma membrane repair [Desmophyllum pertusum]
MSLLLLLKTCSNLRGRSDRIARVTFRGVTYQTSVIENCSEADWDEDFEWPLESPLDPSEFIEIEVYNFNKIFNNRLVGVFRMVLQKLIQDGHLEVAESLIDMNNTVLKANVDLELQYNPPEGNVSQWVNNINDTLDAPPQVGYMPDSQYQMSPMDPYNPDPNYNNREKERRGSFMGSTFGSKASKSQSMTSLTSSSQRHPRKESMPASIGGGGRFISPGDGAGDHLLTQC